MHGLIPIEKDVFSIADRLKEIDERYVLFRNVISHRFEVYVGEALQFVVPFPRLDARTIEFAQKTRIERLDAIVKEIDRLNDLADRRKEKQIIENALQQMGY
ncbi:MAG: hypothetical protein IKC54_03275 [Clostridia bacterium]|nr:hypothetical protein [Clostridia bacterium]